MNNYTERTWTLVTINQSIRELMKTYVEYPPRPLQSEGYSGPITLTQYQRFQFVREALGKEGFNLTLRSEEHTSELQSLMRISYAVFCLKKKKNKHNEKQDNKTRTTHKS